MCSFHSLLSFVPHTGRQLLAHFRNRDVCDGTGKVSSRKVMHFNSWICSCCAAISPLAQLHLYSRMLIFPLLNNLAEAVNRLKTVNKEMDSFLLCFWHFHGTVTSNTSTGERWQRHKTFESICLLLLEIIFENRIGTSLCCTYWVLPQTFNESLHSDL